MASPASIPKTVPLEQQKLMLEIRDLEHASANRSKKEELESKKLQLEIDTLANSVQGFKRFEAVRVWAPALSLFTSVLIGAATLAYQNHRDHEFRVTQEMVNLINKISSKEDPTVQVASALSLGLFGRGVESILVATLSTAHDQEFYLQVAPALLTSIRHGNEGTAVIGSILSNIDSIIDGGPEEAEFEKLRRHIYVLREVMRTLRADKLTNIAPLDLQVTNAKNRLGKVVEARPMGAQQKSTVKKMLDLMRDQTAASP